MLLKMFMGIETLALLMLLFTAGEKPSGWCSSESGDS